MKNILCLLLSLMLLMSGCAYADEEYQKYTHRFFGTFDTIITLTAYTTDEESFQKYATLTESEMLRYHMIFDQYNPYQGVNNLYAVNQSAASQPVSAEPELIDLLLKVREWQKLYGSEANPAMGSVLRLWHDARTIGGYVPELTDLTAASGHMDYSKVIIDEVTGTISFEDAELSLDLGAVAKGYAAQLVADLLEKEGLTSFILNAGGNVVCGPAPLDGRTEWSVAIEDTDGFSTKLIIGTVNTSIVTSGDYQRYYEVDGKRYHHLIDPDTLYPAAHMRAVTIVHPDSGLADFLSTTAFLLPFEESVALISSIAEAEALWTLNDGSEHCTEGFEKLVR